VTDEPPTEDQPRAAPPAPEPPLSTGVRPDQMRALTDEVATMLAALDGTPTAEHAQTYAALHARLHSALGDLAGE
jgi:hypothetical protein